MSTGELSRTLKSMERMGSVLYIDRNHTGTSEL